MMKFCNWLKWLKGRKRMNLLMIHLEFRWWKEKRKTNSLRKPWIIQEIMFVDLYTICFKYFLKNMIKNYIKLNKSMHLQYPLFNLVSFDFSNFQWIRNTKNNKILVFPILNVVLFSNIDIVSKIKMSLKIMKKVSNYETQMDQNICL